MSAPDPGGVLHMVRHEEPSIYLDHHASTPLDPRVFEAMRPWWTDDAANPASTSHQPGLRAATAIEEARSGIADALGAEPAEVVFTSGATEANNLAIKGVVGDRVEQAHLIVNAGEHRAVLDPARRLARRGARVDVVPIMKTGGVAVQAVAETLVAETTLVSVMLANNEVGVINPVAEIAEAAHAVGALVHCDASQAVGKIPVDVGRLEVDLLSLTAHKLYGPPGIGALVVRRRHRPIRLTPLIDGGGHEQGRRSGTLPTPLIVGFAAAVRLAVEELPEEAKRLQSLRDRLWGKLTEWRPDLQRNGSEERGLPGNLNITIPDVNGEALLVALRESPLAVSSGSACTSANPEPSHVLRAMGLSEQAARASLRFGIGRFNTSEDIDRAVTIVRSCVEALV